MASSTKQINHLKETIAINEATISTMSANVTDITAKIATMKATVSDEYLPTVKIEVESIISSLLRLKCTDQTTIDELDTLHNHAIIRLSTAFAKEEEAYKRFVHEYSTDALHNHKLRSTGTTTRSDATLTPDQPMPHPLFPNVQPDNLRVHPNPNTTLHHPYSLPNKDQLRESQYIYDIKSPHPKLHSVNTSGLYKINWKVTCSSEMEIFTFYESLKHMASTCGIPMRQITDIDETTGVCPLSPKNCANYDIIYPLMAGAIYHKINDQSLLKGYPLGWNLVTSNLHDCDGFEVMFDVLGEILPKLNINSAKSVFIKQPVYATMPHDDIYEYISAYKAFLKFENLGTNCRTYSAYEQVVYILGDLDRDPQQRFEKGIDYARTQLSHSVDGISVPRDITISKIAKTVCRYSLAYTVREHAVSENPVVHALKKYNKPSPPPVSSRTPYTNDTRDQDRCPNKTSSLKCKYCGQNGHDETTENGCYFMAKFTLCQQATSKFPESDIKTNTRKFLSKMREQDKNNRQNNRIERHIRTLRDNSATSEDPTSLAIINSLRVLQQSDDCSSVDLDEEAYYAS